MSDHPRRVNAIFAVERNFGLFGAKDKAGRYYTPWHCRDDLRRFAAITKSGTVIMGRNTAETISRPLKGRTNIVLRREIDGSDRFSRVGFHRADSLSYALRISGENPFIIGGAQVLKAAFEEDVIDRIYLSLIHGGGTNIETGPASIYLDKEVTIKARLGYHCIHRESWGDHDFLILERRREPTGLAW